MDSPYERLLRNVSQRRKNYSLSRWRPLLNFGQRRKNFSLSRWRPLLNFGQRRKNFSLSRRRPLRNFSQRRKNFSLSRRRPLRNFSQRRKNFSLSRRERGLSCLGKGYAKVSYEVCPTPTSPAKAGSAGLQPAPSLISRTPQTPLLLLRKGQVQSRNQYAPRRGQPAHKQPPDEIPWYSSGGCCSSNCRFSRTRGQPAYM